MHEAMKRDKGVWQKYICYICFTYLWETTQILYQLPFLSESIISIPAGGCKYKIKWTACFILTKLKINWYRPLTTFGLIQSHASANSNGWPSQSWKDLTIFPPLFSDPQGFSHIQADYQNSVGGSQSPGAPNPVHGQNPDWDSEYCNRDCGPNHCGWAHHSVWYLWMMSNGHDG